MRRIREQPKPPTVAFINKKTGNSVSHSSSLPQRFLASFSSRRWTGDFCGWTIAAINVHQIKSRGFVQFWELLTCYLVTIITNHLCEYLYSQSQGKNEQRRKPVRLLCFSIVSASCAAFHTYITFQPNEEEMPSNAAQLFKPLYMIGVLLLILSRISASMCTNTQALSSNGIGVAIATCGEREFTMKFVRQLGKNVNVAMIAFFVFVLSAETMMKLENSDLTQVGAVPKDEYVRVLQSIMESEPNYFSQQQEFMRRAADMDPTVRARLEKQLKRNQSKTDGFVKLVRSMENRASDRFDTGLEFGQVKYRNARSAALA